MINLLYFYCVAYIHACYMMYYCNDIKPMLALDISSAPFVSGLGFDAIDEIRHYLLTDEFFDGTDVYHHPEYPTLAY